MMACSLSYAVSRRGRALLAVLAGACMVGCADLRAPTPAESKNAEVGREQVCESKLTPAENTRIAGIEQMVNDGKFYAALAQLDALGVNAPQALLIRADALRRIDRIDESRAIYQQLVGSCLDGRAQHGLGLIAARAGQQAASLAYLQKARQALPTDPRIRNDLGYALLLANQWDAAEFEFLTALDLNPQDPRASRNVVLLTFRRGQADKAFALAKQLGLDRATAERLQEQALTLTSKPLPNLDNGWKTP